MRSPFFGVLGFDDAGRPREFVSGHNPQPSDVSELVKNSLQFGPKSRSQIRQETGQTVGALATMLGLLVKRGEVVRVGRGLYSKADK
jgi:hypothetical protein